MYLRCPKCATFVPAPAELREGDSIHCSLCRTPFRPTRGQALQCRRARQEEDLRCRFGWLDQVGSLAVFLLTVGALYLALTGAPPKDPFTGPMFRLIPACVSLLTAAVWVGYRLDRAGCFPSLRKTALVLLLALAAPLVYSVLPFRLEVPAAASSHSPGKE
jgi:hypothetical protein